MSTPRITVVTLQDETGKATGVNLYVNPEGRDLLIEELNRLSESSDHFHMDAAEWAMEVPLGMNAYIPAEETVVSNMKVLFRTDDWDRQYFPHVVIEERKI